jgi:hypothetical protein
MSPVTEATFALTVRSSDGNRMIGLLVEFLARKREARADIVAGDCVILLYLLEGIAGG